MKKKTTLSELSKKVGDFSKSLGPDGQGRKVPIGDILTPAFVSKHTGFSDVDEMLRASGFEIRTTEDFAAVPDGRWDEFIRSISSFPDWSSMLGAAGKEWIVNKLDL